MARMRVQGSRIMISGHETTNEECNAVTLMCDEMAKSKDFRLVEYRPGYAEFEAVGKAEDLKFLPSPGDLIISFDSHITEVSMTDAGGLHKWTTSGQSIGTMAQDGTLYTFNVTLADGYILDQATGLGGEGGSISTVEETSFTANASNGGISGAITLTSKANAIQVTMTSKDGVTLATEGTYCDSNIAVAPDATSQANLVAENIRENVSILGVTGTLSAEPGADGKTPVLTQSTINFIPSTTQNGQFTIGAEVETGDPIIIACTGSGTYDGRSWMVVGDVMSFASTSHVAVVDVTGVTETTGEQGPQGEQGATGSPGAAGADGEDGEPPVIATQDSYSGVPVTGTSQQYTLDTWSRVPASGDDIMIMVAGQAGTASADRTFISVGTVVSATSQSPNYAVTVNVVGVQETTGQAGAAGVGVPSGGTTGQVLKKASNTNYDTEWADESGGGGGDTVIDLGSLTIDGEGGYAGTISQSVYNSITPGSKVKFSAMGLLAGYGIVSAMGDPATYYGDLTVYYNGRVLNYSIEITSSLSVHVYSRDLISSYVPDTAGDFTSVSNIVTTTADSPDASSLPEGTLVIKIAS